MSEKENWIKPSVVFLDVSYTSSEECSTKVAPGNDGVTLNGDPCGS